MNIVDRFLHYTTINTTTDMTKGRDGIIPSSLGQLKLAEQLFNELNTLGLHSVKINEHAIVTALLPANLQKKLPCVAFFAHLDTGSEYYSDTHAQILTYHGGDICLNSKEKCYLKQDEHPALANYIGEDLITTDGTSLLGADNKAAIAAIMNALQYLVAHPEIKHGDVRVAFVPDEEQELLGAKLFNVQHFPADFGYTLNACSIGELICENWHAGQFKITFYGEVTRPISINGKLRNALLMAHKFISLLPSGDDELADNQQGYYWVKFLQGSSSQSVLNVDVRDFSAENYQKRKQHLRAIIAACQQLFGRKTIRFQENDLYDNVNNALQKSHYPVIELAKSAYENLGILPKEIALRGGYDGAIFTEKGIPCPNLFSGAQNCHSIYEYLPVKSLQLASDVVVEIIRLIPEKC